MYFYDLKCVFEFWTNQTMLKLTYCNLHHHLVLLIFHNTILQDTQNIHVMNTSLWEYTFFRQQQKQLKMWVNL